MTKNLLTIAVLCIAALSITQLASSSQFSIAHTGTDIGGTITADTSWTKEGSPYNFIYPVTINKGVTLTVEPGVTVKTNEFYLEVNGTIKAQGTPNENIVFTSWYRSQSNLSKLYSGYNIILTSSDNIFENSVFNTTPIGTIGILSFRSVIFNNNTFTRLALEAHGKATITNNIFDGGNLAGWNGILVENGLFTITNNTIRGRGINTVNASVVVSNNTFIGNLEVIGQIGVVVDRESTAIICNNAFYQYTQACIFVNGCFAQIEKNIIQNNVSIAQYHNGFGIQVASANPIIQNNTITECQLGILIYNNIYDYEPKGEAKPTIINNNVYSNRGFNIYLGFPDGYHHYNSTQSTATNVSASLNWWGTTDPAAINQTIYDFKNLPNLGTVAFTPYLAAPNPQALPDPNSPIPTPLPLPTSSPTPSIEDHDPTPFSLQLGIVAVMIVAVAVSLVIYFKKLKGNKEKD
jgi:hypothetical protein